MMEQKFKRGNKVKILFGSPMWTIENGKTTISDSQPEDIGKEVLIIGSYNDLYGGGGMSKYKVMYCDTGNTSAWKHENNLEFIEEGGEHLIDQAKAKAEEKFKFDTDLTQLVSIWVEKQGRLSSDTILFLFDKIGFRSVFLLNGEYYSLINDWSYFYPLFNAIFTYETKEAILICLKEPFDLIIKENIIKLFDEVQLIKNQL